jgi:predicted nucleic acid-binding protein
VIVVDASALVGLLLGEPATIAALEQVPRDRRAGPFHAPALIEPETLNALCRLERHEVLDALRARRAVAELGALRRELYPHGPFLRRAWELRHELSAYDAMYLAIAERIGAVLFTADRALARRARRVLGADGVQTV